ncbi:hypothetical protein J2Y69_001483 [Microbacterium resistens]|uniref:DUF3618 domain-containing protein n=1 Tax=Microbacterium resistens TaxID=156977 RepID=A0ABU1SBD8_9MICO|nr:hypothetical protein [Microbacterium resistens]MDR6866884.1 hypothetical protein [Microbacterium resistens]
MTTADPRNTAGSRSTAGQRASASLPRTAVPHGIADPVTSARAELKAALAAIEVKGNLPRRLEKASTEAAGKARAFARRNPAGAIAGAIGIAVAVGGIVWATARILSR